MSEVSNNQTLGLVISFFNNNSKEVRRTKQLITGLNRKHTEDLSKQVNSSILKRKCKKNTEIKCLEIFWNVFEESPPIIKKDKVNICEKDDCKKDITDGRIIHKNFFYSSCKCYTGHSWIVKLLTQQFKDQVKIDTLNLCEIVSCLECKTNILYEESTTHKVTLIIDLFPIRHGKLVQNRNDENNKLLDGTAVNNLLVRITAILNEVREDDEIDENISFKHNFIWHGNVNDDFHKKFFRKLEEIWNTNLGDLGIFLYRTKGWFNGVGEPYSKHPKIKSTVRKLNQ